MSYFAEKPPKAGSRIRRKAVTYHNDGTKTEHYDGALTPIRNFRGAGAPLTRIGAGSYTGC